ncbi:UDP-glucuronic acid decarboxylase 1-like isoform X2 [Halichondria panicea]|uniref:UDP-glucuronic acid decarboxylase 1-like isoform X2 n=1 Tax=Halichondria panicea TaxID=6063 RepID=UPI00312BBE76
MLKHRPLCVTILLLAALFSTALLLISWNTSAVDSTSVEYQRSSADVVSLKKEVKRLNERIRFLEEDSLFRGGHGGNSRSALSDQKSYPSVKRLVESDRKRILVTGGSGFVGSHLVDRLLLDGHEVYAVDNFFTGRKRNLEHWIGHENFELLNHDIVNPLMLEVDQIYHLASPASPVKYMYNPIKTLKTNTVGTLNMLGLAKRVRARFLFASTSEVYGDPQVHPQNESYWGHVNPIGPRACYDEGKRVSETMVYAYQKQENVDVRVARIFNTFGPRMHMYDGRVVSNFIIQALLGKPLTVYSPGDQTRSFMYVSDLVTGLIALMGSNYSLPVNLGNPEEHTITEFAQIILDMLDGGKVVMRPHNQDDPYKRKPNIARAQRILQWNPVVPLKTGLLKTIDYFKQEIENSTNNDIR